MVETQALYVLIANDLRQSIQHGEFRPGDQLPPETALRERYSSSRGSVRHALELLRSEGLISSGQGRRSRVISAVPAQNFDDIISFSQWCINAGYTPGQRTISKVERPAPAELAALLELSPGDPIISIYRLRLINNEPTMVERLNYPQDIGAHLMNFDTDSGSIYAHFLRSQVDFHHADRIIDAISSEDKDAELLRIAPSSPLLRVRRRSFDSKGRPIEASDDRYLPHAATFRVTNVRGHASTTQIRHYAQH